MATVARVWRLAWSVLVALGSPVAPAVYADHFTAFTGLTELSLEMWSVVATVLAATAGTVAFLVASILIRKRYIESDDANRPPTQNHQDTELTG